MTKDEMKQKCEGRAKIFQQAMESCKSSSPMDCIEWFADRIVELETQIEKMKCCENCKRYKPCFTCNETIGNDCDYYNGGNVCEKWQLN